MNLKSLRFLRFNSSQVVWEQDLLTLIKSTDGMFQFLIGSLGALSMSSGWKAQTIVSIPHRQSGSSSRRQTNERSRKFQFLIGSLGATDVLNASIAREKFQFLIGSLGANSFGAVVLDESCFNSSQVVWEHNLQTSCNAQEGCFNSSQIGRAHV